MQDCIFLVADKQMESVFKGFLKERNNCHLSLGTRPFTCEIKADRAGNDPGLYTRSHELLRPYYRTHQHAVVVLDQDWKAAPEASIIRTKIKNDLIGNGWGRDNVEVIVIDPELEIWLWQDSPHIANIFQFNYHPYLSLKSWLEDKGMWSSTQLKPAHPKKAFELLCIEARIPHSSAIYSKIVQRVSVNGCTDRAFCLLLETLQRWFPPEGGR